VSKKTHCYVSPGAATPLFATVEYSYYNPPHSPPSSTPPHAHRQKRRGDRLDDRIRWLLLSFSLLPPHSLSRPRARASRPTWLEPQSTNEASHMLPLLDESSAAQLRKKKHCRWVLCICVCVCECVCVCTSKLTWASFINTRIYEWWAVTMI